MTPDRNDPEGAIAESAKSCSNWGVGARATCSAPSISSTRPSVERPRAGPPRCRLLLSQRFDMDGPQKGWRRRTNPVHTMLDTGTDAALGNQGFPHGLGGADDVIAMPLQCSTQWDGLGHIFDHGRAWNGRDAARTVTSDGDLVTGIEHMAPHVAGRGVLLDVGRVVGEQGELPDGFAITQEHLERTAEAHGVRVGAVTWSSCAPDGSPGPGGMAGATTRAVRPPACPSPPRPGCTVPRSLRSPPTPGVSRSGPMSSSTPSSRCTRSPSRTSGC